MRGDEGALTYLSQLFFIRGLTNSAVCMHGAIRVECVTAIESPSVKDPKGNATVVGDVGGDRLLWAVR